MTMKKRNACCWLAILFTVTMVCALGGCALNEPFSFAKFGWAGKMPAADYMQGSTTYTVESVYISPTGGTDVYKVRESR